MKRHLSIMFLFVIYVSQSYSYFNFSHNHEKAYNDIFNMHFVDASAALSILHKSEPKNFCTSLLDSEMEFLRAFVSEERIDFDILITNNDKRLSALAYEDEISPYHRYVHAELLLHNAYVRLKWNEYIKAAFEVRKAFKLLEENKKLFPAFAPTLKSLGILHAFMAAVPENYKWVANLAGMHGTIAGGIAEINSLLNFIETKKENTHLKNEALVWLIFIETHLNKQEGRSLQLINRYHDVYASPLTVFSVGNVYFHFQQNDKLLKLFDGYKDDGRTYPMVFLHYFRGVAYLNALDQKGVGEFEYFLKNYKGRNYFKGAYQRLAWLALLRNDDKAYSQQIANCLSKGSDFVDEDLLAMSEAKHKEKPNLILLRARLLFDGGYFQHALKELAGRNDKLFPSFREKLEYIYRTARVFEMLKMDDKAIELYQKTIDLGKDQRYAFAANAAYFLGQMYEVKKDNTNAEKFYKLCLSMRNHDYQNSMDQKAKAGLNRIKRDTE